jgi:alpha-L-arabinofuranosidase
MALALRMNSLVVLTCLLLSPAVAQEKRIAVTLNPSKTREPIQPYIYSQFIEHLGRCIYGGIWAEMLEDRKFYFPVTPNYDPYKSLENTEFPVVGASPWQIVGNESGVEMDRKESFVGDHTPKIEPGTGIQHRDLALVEGKDYVGYVWVKGAGQVKVSVSRGESTPEQLAIIDATDEYTKHDFRFLAPEDTDHSILRFDVLGDGAVHIGTASLMPADNIRGMRRDTLAVLKQLDAPMYRWPGGNFVSGYEWRDGIGDRDRRPPRKNPAWTGVEHNDMGIIEFVGFCREVNAEPLIAANTGFGDAHSAGAEVEFCNGAADTYGGGLRAKLGHPEPLEVKYWCVGNEMFGAWQLGFMQLSQYTLKHNQCAQAMRDADPSIELIGVGELGGRDPEHDPDRKYGWSEAMLRECADHMDYLSEHFYVGQTPWTRTGPSASVAAHVDEMRQAIRKKADGHRKLQDRLGLTGDKRMPIAMDEWNYWHRDYVYGELGCRYDLADGLGVAVGLHEYFRNTDIIHMAHYDQTVNVIGCIKTTKTDAFMATTALPLMVYRKHFGATPIEVTIAGESLDVDVTAAVTDDRKTLTIGVVNPNEAPVRLELSMSEGSMGSKADQWLVAGDDPRAYNEVSKKPVEVAHEAFLLNEPRWTSPGYSFAVIRVPLE